LKRFVACFLLLLALTAFAVAQEQPKPEAQEAAGHEPNQALLWANFVILAGFLGYLIFKNVPPLLRARSEEIQSAMRESGRLKAESEARLAEIERRLSGIASEIDKLRVELITEMNAEGSRLRAETERMLTRIHQQAEQEIQLMTKSSRLELKAFSAQLAIDLASQRIRARMNHDTQQSMVNAFISDLRKDGNRGTTPS
jgi:F0F1-type ATP synthase membrane subunit b/b'